MPKLLMLLSVTGGLTGRRILIMKARGYSDLLAGVLRVNGQKEIRSMLHVL